MIPVDPDCYKYGFLDCLYIESNNRVPYYLYQEYNTLYPSVIMNETGTAMSPESCAEKCDKVDTCTGGQFDRCKGTCWLSYGPMQRQMISKSFVQRPDYIN